MSERTKITTKKAETKKENSASKTQKTEYSQSMNSPVDQVLYLQRTIGNQAVQRLFKSGVIQAKLKIGQPNDIYEQEADRMAERVMRMPEQIIQKQTEEEKEFIQTKPLAEQISPLVQRQEDSASSSSATNPLSGPLTSEEGAKIITSGETWLGIPYLYDGDSREGIDCSHFVHRAYVEAGFDYDYLNTAALPKSPNFVPVAIPQAGDLILFQGHVGIYNPKPPEPGKTVLNAGKSGVHYGRPSWYKGPYTYYRYFKTVTTAMGSSLQRKTAISGSADTINVVHLIHHEAIRKGGIPLPSAERAFFEPRFGIDLRKETGGRC